MFSAMSLRFYEKRESVRAQCKRRMSANRCDRGIKSNSFTVHNGVKQGGVLSPLLFSIYLDTLLCDLTSCGYGCYVGSKFMGAMAYADDIVLLSPNLNGLKTNVNSV